MMECATSVPRLRGSVEKTERESLAEGSAPGGGNRAGPGAGAPGRPVAAMARKLRAFPLMCGENRSRKGALLLALLWAAVAVGAFPQEPGVVETRSVRIHLKNGNVLDGDMILETRQSVTLRTKTGEITLDRGTIDRLERIRTRTAVVKPEAKPPVSTPPAHRTAPPPGPNPVIERILEQLLTAREERSYGLLQQLILAGRPAVGYLVRRLGTIDGRIRPFVAAALIEIRDPGAIPGLIGLLDHAHPDLRAEACRILGLLGDPSAAEALLPAIKDASPLVRGAAIEALGTLGTRGSFRAIAPSCADPVREVRLRALQVLPALAQRQDRWDDLESALIDALNATRGDAKADVIAVFGLCRFKHAARLMIPCLRDDSPAVRGAAAEALCALEAWNWADRILERIREEEDPGVRVRLAAVASRFKPRASIEPLISWLGDPDPLVARAAREALRSLTGQDLGPDPARWSAWWEAARPRG